MATTQRSPLWGSRITPERMPHSGKAMDWQPAGVGLMDSPLKPCASDLRSTTSGSSGSGDPDAAAAGDRGTRAAVARPCHNPLCRNALRPPAIPAHMLAHPADERIWPEPRESPILAHLPMLYHSPPHRVDTAWTGDARQPLGTALPRNPQVRQERACPHPPPARRGKIAKPRRAQLQTLQPPPRSAATPYLLTVEVGGIEHVWAGRP